MAKSKYTVADFLTKTKHETATKMPLLFEGKDTGIYFLVKGIEARSIAQSRFIAQKSIAALPEIDNIKDDIDAMSARSESEESIKIDFAVELIEDWSFDECISGLRQLLEENKGLSDSVIAHASTATNYFTKK